MLRVVLRYIGVLAGVLLTALGLDLFLVPNKIAAGGVSGIATILHHLFHVPVGMTMLAFDLPLFIIAFIRMGMGFGLRSLFGSVTLAISIDLLAPYLPVPTEDLLLASIFGGVVTGLGLGLVFRNQGSTGGTDMAAAIIRSYTGMNVGQLLFMVDATVVLAAGLAFQSWELAMYALITIFITSKVIDLVQEGFSYAKAFFIITSEPRLVAEVIIKEMDRGATCWQAQGMFTGGQRHVLLSVVARQETTKLKQIIHQADPKAFVVLTDVHEVLGEGFKPITTK
ncbi:YitT family protein [Peptococcaceae bacterium 1198_IL3148]